MYHIISLSLTYWDIPAWSDISYHISISYLMRYSNLIRYIISLSLTYWDIPAWSNIAYHISISYLKRYSNLIRYIISYLYLLPNEIFQPDHMYHIISLSLTYNWDIPTLSDVSYHISIAYLMRYSYLIRYIISYFYLLPNEIFQPYQIYHIISLSLT